jgi:hypothetical protein
MELVSQSSIAVAVARGQFGNPEERERPPLEAWKPLSSNGSENVTVDTSVHKCATGNCEL